MPIIQIHIRKGRTEEQKRELMKRVTDAVEESLGVKRESIRIMIHELDGLHYSVSGIPIQDQENEKW